MSLLDDLDSNELGEVAEPQFVMVSFYFDMVIIWLLRCVRVIIYHS